MVIFVIRRFRLKMAEFAIDIEFTMVQSDLTCSGDLFKNEVFQSLTIG